MKSYAVTLGQIGASKFEAKSGVRQGLSTSCSLFTFFIDPTIDAIARGGKDGWLQNLHGLLFMDDTVVLATSRQKMMEKLENLNCCIHEIGMVINASKSHFLCVYGDSLEPFDLDGTLISHVDCYPYLGTPISVTSIADQTKAHLQSKSGHLFKFYSFLRKNDFAPYAVKRKVWDSALCSALFYSCESWFTKDFRDAETAYHASLKNMLGVRMTTCNDLVCVEAGEAGAKGFIQQRQYNFLAKLKARNSYHGSYIEWVIEKAKECRSPGGLALQVIESFDQDPFSSELEKKKTSISTSNSSRRMAYLALNPGLTVSPVYCVSVRETERLSFSRMRLSSHRLAFETGRWSRTPAEERLCSCGCVQNDAHILLRCKLTEQSRQGLGIHVDNLKDLFDFNVIILCTYIHQCLEILS